MGFVRIEFVMLLACVNLLSKGVLLIGLRNREREMESWHLAYPSLPGCFSQHESMGNRTTTAIPGSHSCLLDF